MRVHFASGPHPFREPWVNVDLERDPPVDLLDPLPEWIDDIEIAYVGHFLEHLTQDEGIDLLDRIRERMRAGGRIFVIGPDADRGQQQYTQHLIPHSLYSAIIAHGEMAGPGGRHRGNCHLWNCTGPQVVRMLEIAGWHSCEEFPIGSLPDLWPEVPVIELASWQFAATAAA